VYVGVVSLIIDLMTTREKTVGFKRARIVGEPELQYECIRNLKACDMTEVLRNFLYKHNLHRI
jgi:hypothetical protein